MAHRSFKTMTESERSTTWRVFYQKGDDKWQQYSSLDNFPSGHLAAKYAIKLLALDMVIAVRVVEETAVIKPQTYFSRSKK